MFGSDPFSGSGSTCGTGGTSGGRGGVQSAVTPSDPFTSDPFTEDPFGLKGNVAGEDANPFGSGMSDVFGSKGWVDSKVCICTFISGFCSGGANV